jgi:hypothetical protein
MALGLGRMRLRIVEALTAFKADLLRWTFHLNRRKVFPARERLGAPACGFRKEPVLFSIYGAGVGECSTASTIRQGA